MPAIHTACFRLCVWIVILRSSELQRAYELKQPCPWRGTQITTTFLNEVQLLYVEKIYRFKRRHFEARNL